MWLWVGRVVKLLEHVRVRCLVQNLYGSVQCPIHPFCSICKRTNSKPQALSRTLCMLMDVGTISKKRWNRDWCLCSRSSLKPKHFLAIKPFVHVEYHVDCWLLSWKKHRQGARLVSGRFHQGKVMKTLIKQEEDCSWCNLSLALQQGAIVSSLSAMQPNVTS